MIIALIVLLIVLVAGFFILKMFLEKSAHATNHVKSSKPIVNSTTLDEEYAKVKGLWICEYCETLNEAGKNKCAACGKGR